MASLSIDSDQAWSRDPAAAPQAGHKNPASTGRDVLIALPRFGSGGASKVTAVLAGALAATGLDVAIATFGPAEGVTRRCLDSRVAAISLSKLGGSSRGVAASVAALPGLVLMLRRLKPAVLLSAGNHANLFTALAHAVAGAHGTALVLKLTNPIVRRHGSPLRRWIKIQVYRALMWRADTVLALSPEDAAQAAALAPAAADRIRVVANPYLIDVCARARPSPEPGAPPTVLAVGRLTRQKNVGLLLHALARLQDLPWRLQVLGAGKDRSKLEALAGQLGLGERVDFLGYVPDPAPYYAGARVLAITSRWEALPAVAVEALAHGCAVVTTECSSALSRLVRDSGGVVTPSCDRAFAQALAEVLQAPVSCSRPDGIQPYTLASATRSHLLALGPLLARGGCSPQRPSPDGDGAASRALEPLAP